MKDFFMKYSIETIITAFVAFLIKKYYDLKNKGEATQNGVKALLRDRIIATYDLHIGKQYMSVYAKENVQELYKEYKKLKGNGVVDHLIEELYKLPTEEKK